MKPKHLFYGVAFAGALIGIDYTMRGSFGMALLAAMIASCCLLNATRKGENKAFRRGTLKRFLGIR